MRSKIHSSALIFSLPSPSTTVLTVASCSTVYCICAMSPSEPTALGTARVRQAVGAEQQRQQPRWPFSISQRALNGIHRARRQRAAPAGSTGTAPVRWMSTTCFGIGSVCVGLLRSKTATGATTGRPDNTRQHAGMAGPHHEIQQHLSGTATTERVAAVASKQGAVAAAAVRT